MEEEGHSQSLSWNNRIVDTMLPLKPYFRHSLDLSFLNLESFAVKGFSPV